MQGKSFLSAALATLLALGLVPCLTGQAHADWVFDHFQQTVGAAPFREQGIREGKITWEQPFANNEIAGSGGGGDCSASTNSVHHLSEIYRWEVYPTSFTLEAKLSGTLQPVYRWEATEIGYDPETDETIWDEPDPRPFWILEVMSLSTSGRGGNITLPAGQPDFGMKSPQAVPPGPDEDGRNPEPYFTGYDGPGDFGTQRHTVTGLKFQKVQPAGKWAYGQQRTFKYSIVVDRPGGFSGTGQSASAEVAMSYEARIVSLGLMVKRMEDGGGNAGIGHILQTDPGHSFGNGGLTGGLALTAGGLDNNQHKCEVWLTMSPAFGGVLPARCYPKVGIAYKNGKAVNAEFKPLGLDVPTAVVSDWAGYYQAYMGEIVSRDVTKRIDGETIEPKVFLGYGMNNPGCSVPMTWANVEWKMGENGEKAWNPKFLIIDSDVTEWVWTQAKSAATDKVLKGHTVKVVASHLVVAEEDPVTHRDLAKIFTSDPVEFANHQDTESEVMIYDDDLTGKVSAYMTLPGAQTLGDDGVYKGQVTIKYGTAFIVENFKLALEDQGVFTKVTP